ncbi:hypothetical protein E2562_005891 [Oryza meyeriana var. granulata]|uniref:DUF834 domain-containing protein n=1 Tax=Oryza meyeriana var. granulata TaxID=110450 RepID=A0A6G1DTW0_9ORYZ|nr:hypothetical protein E2562_005891 [Oryza meyeriana var. granulata]
MGLGRGRLATATEGDDDAAPMGDGAQEQAQEIRAGRRHSREAGAERRGRRLRLTGGGRRTTTGGGGAGGVERRRCPAAAAHRTRRRGREQRD